MPIFTIRRRIPGLSQEDMAAAAFRAIGCAAEYPGMHWHQSYWDREAGVLTCVYEAGSVAQIEDHARRARIPCDDVREVTVVGPDDYIVARHG